LRNRFSDPDRAVDSNEQYQKNNLNNDKSAPSANMGDDEVMQKIEVKGDEFSGLIGNIAGNLIRDKFVVTIPPPLMNTVENLIESMSVSSIEFVMRMAREPH
ncbi:hypothetical protein ANCCAN_13866, partial [Ancylostoma caninum]